MAGHLRTTVIRCGWVFQPWNASNLIGVVYHYREFTLYAGT